MYEHAEDKIITKNDIYLIGELNDNVKKLLASHHGDHDAVRKRGGSNSSHSHSNSGSVSQSSVNSGRHVMHAIDYLIAGYLRRFEKKMNKRNTAWYIPKDLNQIIVGYMANGSKWDNDSRNDDVFTVSQNGLRVFSVPFQYQRARYSTIFIDNWLSKDGVYEFELEMGILVSFLFVFFVYFGDSL